MQKKKFQNFYFYKFWYCGTFISPFYLIFLFELLGLFFVLSLL